MNTLDPATKSANVRQSVEQYLSLNTNRLVEFRDGVLDYLPAPTQYHQILVLALGMSLRQRSKFGLTLFAPFPVRVGEFQYRTPDVVFMSNEHSSKRNNRFWDGADLVMEVVSPRGRKRDFEDNRRDYAEAGIPEYWIIDPEKRRVVDLTLKGEEYVERGTYPVGKRASSLLLKGFSVDVTKLFKSADAMRKSGGSEG